MKSKAESAGSLVALFGFLTAVTGLAQTMWTTAPWWRQDKAADVATASSRPPRPHHIPKGWDGAIEGTTEVDSAPIENTDTPIGVHLLFGGGAALVVGAGVKVVLSRKRKKQEDDEKQMLA